MPGSRKLKSSYYDGRPFGSSSSLPDIRLDEIRVIGSLYLLKPLLEKIGIREAVDRVIPMQRDVGGLTHGQVLEQLIINRLDAPLGNTQYLFLPGELTAWSITSPANCTNNITILHSLPVS